MASRTALMMVLCDTTVWIDFFAGRNLSHVQRLERLIDDREDVCICGIILTEVLQGICRDREYRTTRELFDHLVFLPMTFSVFLRSADIHRSLRRKGITVRNAVDCMIASVAIENGVSILHNDRDFDPIEKHCGLKVHREVQ